MLRALATNSPKTLRTLAVLALPMLLACAPSGRETRRLDVEVGSGRSAEDEPARTGDRNPGEDRRSTDEPEPAETAAGSAASR